MLGTQRILSFGPLHIQQIEARRKHGYGSRKNRSSMKSEIYGIIWHRATPAGLSASVGVGSVAASPPSGRKRMATEGTLDD